MNLSIVRVLGLYRPALGSTGPFFDRELSQEQSLFDLELSQERSLWRSFLWILVVGFFFFITDPSPAFFLSN